MHSFTSGYSMPNVHFCVLLLFFLSISSVNSVCQHCYGAGTGCSGDGTKCPWVTQIQANASSIALAGGGALVVATLLPAKLLRLFPRFCLDAISALVSKVASQGNPFDYSTNPSSPAVVNAVKLGSSTRQDAVLYLNDTIQAASGDDASITIKKLESAIKTIENIDVRLVSNTSSSEGAHIYILFKLSSVVSSSAKGSTSLDACFECDSSESSRPIRSFSASLVRPSSRDHMYSLLNLFCLCCHAMGLSSFLALSPFLEDVIFEPVRDGSVSWPVAFECLVIYLRMIESNPSDYSVSTVYHKAGGIDSIREKARVAAISNFPASCFRTHGANPETGFDAKHDKDAIFKGSISDFNHNSKRACTSWNLGKPHFAKHVQNGKCTFFHGCSQYVSDKGTAGQCLADHKRDACQYDAAKKRSSPLP